jgi:hypothetical protein
VSAISHHALADLVDVVGGSTVPSGSAVYEVYSVPSYDLGEPERLPGQLIKSSKRPVAPDDVLLCKINPRINRVWRVKAAGELTQIASTEWFALRCRQGLLPAYLEHVLRAPSYRSRLTEMVSGTTGSHTRARLDVALQIEVLLPPVAEQRRIVALLDEATQLIADLELAFAQTLAKFDDLRASTLMSVMNGDVPTEMRELDDVAAVEYGERVVRARDGGTIYPVYGGGGATFSIDRYNREDCYIVSRFGMSETCVRHVEGKFFLNDSGLSVRTANASIVCQEYLDCVLLANQDRIFAMSTGTAQKNLDVPSFRKLPIPVPTMADQRRLVSAYDEVERFAKCGDVLTRQRIDQVRDLRQSVLEAALRGDL